MSTLPEPTAVANVQQGFITGATSSQETPAGDTTIGGSAAGAGNVISGNTMDGIQITGTGLGPYGQATSDQGNFILGNFIGTDATGKASIPNGGNGVDLIGSATNNIIGGSAPGSGNLIANNKQNGVLIDPGSGTGNNTIANIIQSNGGAGVRINTGAGNRISQNSISGNGDLGINLQNAGPNLNTPCNSSNTGANNLQNAPSLTAGSGTAFITATATDPNGTPASAASFAATLTIADNASGSPLTITLTGTGTAPPAPAVSITPSSLTFSSVTGSTSAEQTVTLKNTGNAVLNLIGVTLMGTGSADFASTDTCGTSLAASASCSISVTFTPASAANFSASLSIADNASGSPQAVSLTGSGTPPPTPAFTITSSTGADYNGGQRRHVPHHRHSAERQLP